ncbi:MAG: CYCXC family (seleno)protein [Thermodesulfobacteriota bacterium]
MKGCWKRFLSYSAVLFIGISLAACSATHTGNTHGKTPKTPGKTHAPTTPPKEVGGETGGTLSPDEFSGESREAYRIAEEMPEVIDRLPCYCGCMKELEHVSLLSCFVDEHAAGCKSCKKEAIRASELYEEGKSVEEIRAVIAHEFGKKK